MRALLLLLALPLWAAEDANAILQRLIKAEEANDRKAEQYTYVQQLERYRFDRDGEPRLTASETHEMIFVEGLAYRKLVARNGQPLLPKEQARVDKEMQRTAEERRKHDRPVAPGGRVIVRGFFGSKPMDLGDLREVLVLFDNRIAGEEEVRGHKTWVIECEPENLEGGSAHEKQVRSFHKKFWVDQKDGVLVRATYTVAAERQPLGPGSNFSFDFEKIDADVWEPIEWVINAGHAGVNPFKPDERLVFKMDQFKKFDVQSTITVK